MLFNCNRKIDLKNPTLELFNVMSFETTKKNIFKLLEENEEVRHNFWIQIQYNLHLYPPALNENKFIYGKIGEHIIINSFKQFFTTEDLDSNHSNGAEYLNDCSINENKFSIKMVKNKSSTIIISNKNSKYNNHLDDIKNINFIVCNIERRRLYIFKHTPELDKFINNTDSQIKYNSSIFTFLDKNKENYFEFVETTKIKTVLKKIRKMPIPNVYEQLFNRLICSLQTIFQEIKDDEDINSITKGIDTIEFKE